MRKFFCIISALLVFAACRKPLIQNNEAELRIYNNTSSIFDSVIVNSPGGKQVYYAIPAGTSSGYKSFSFLYNYAYIEVYYNNKKLKLQPIDYVGEEKLKAGKYSYQIGIMFNLQEFLTLNCKKD